jgi:hypothetical protein
MCVAQAPERTTAFNAREIFTGKAVGRVEDLSFKDEPCLGGCPKSPSPSGKGD